MSVLLRLKTNAHVFTWALVTLLLSTVLEAGPRLVKIKGTYTGVIQVQTLDPKTFAPRTESAPRVVTNEIQYRELVARIPQKEISMTAGAGPSKDPLLSSVVVDFKKDMMVVLVSGESMYDTPEMPEVVQESSRIVVKLQNSPRKGHMMAQPVGLGAYRAIVISKSDFPIGFE